MKRLLIILVISFLSCELTAGEYVANPFATELSRKNFRSCFSKINDSDLKELANIKLYGYDDIGPSFECEKGDNSCNPLKKYRKVFRRVHFDANTLSRQHIHSMVMSNEGGNCSYTRMRNFNYSITRNRIDVHFHPFKQHRNCWLGKNDTYSEEADVDVEAFLTEDLSFNQKVKVSNERGSIFGFINIGWIKDLFYIPKTLLKIDLQKMIVSIFSQGSINQVANDLDFGQGGIDLYSSQNTKRKLAKLDEIGLIAAEPYKVERDLSGFLNDQENLNVEVVYSTIVRESFSKEFYDARLLEVELLRHLNDLEPKKYTVQKGDNLWSIVKKEYMDARLYTLILTFNELDKVHTLMPGQILYLPQWHDICERLGGNPRAVVAGESLWEKVSNGQLPKNHKMIKNFSGKPALIYPLEILEVESDQSLH